MPSAADFDAPAFNIATARERDVLALAEAVGRVLGKTPRLEFAPPRAGELFRSSLDIGKARRVLGWTPNVEFDDGLRELVDWFRKEGS